MGTRRHIDLGTCTLHEIIGRGGASVIYSGERQGEPVAVKFVEDAERERVALGALSHPNIITLIEHGALSEEPAHALSLRPGTPYMILERAPGGTLQDVRHSLSWPQIRDVLLTLLEALGHAHARGVLHRDLKPANVLVRSGTLAPEDLLLGDFGLSWSLHTPHGQQAPPPVGTPSYMAPEQIRHQWRDQGAWTDLYSVGCLAWQLLHGHPPFTGEDEEEVLRAHLVGELPEYTPRVNAPERLLPWLRTMLSRRIHDRFHFAADAARSLHRLDSLSGLSPSLERWGTRTDRPPIDPRALLQRRPLSTVGRDAELDLLRATLHQTGQDARPRAVLLEAAPGIGASHLARAFLERSHELGKARCLRAHTHPAQDLEPLQKMVSHNFRLAGMSRDDAYARIRESLRRMAIPEDTRTTLREDSQALTALLFDGEDPQIDALARWLQRRSRARPLLVWLDDAHHSPSALALLEHVLGRLEGGASIVFVVTLGRETPGSTAEHITSLRGLERVEHRVLEPLMPLEYAALLGRFPGLDAELRAELEARTERNPGVTLALLTHWMAQGALELLDGDRWRRAHGHRLGVPASLHADWEERIARALRQLPERAARTGRTALELGALLSPNLDPKLWRDACTTHGIELPRALLSFLHVTSLLRVREGRWELAHPMLRETLLAHLEDPTALHTACAQAITKRLGRDAPRLVPHLIGSGALDQAREVGFAQARALLERADFAGTERALRQLEPACLQARDRLAWWTLGIALHTSQGMPHQAEALLTRARGLATEPGERARLDVWGARIAALHGHPRQARELGRRARALATDELTLSRALRAQGEAEVRLGRYGEASEHLLQALDGFESTGDSIEHGRTLLALSRVYHALGDEEAGDELIEHAARGFETSGDVLALASCHNLRGERARQRGELAQAVTHYQESYRLLRALDSRESLLPCLNMVVTLIELGSFDRARVLMDPLLEALEREGQLGYLGGLEVAGLCCDAHDEDWGSWDGRFERARELLARAGVFEPDTAALASLAGDAAHERGHAARASRAYQIAYQQWVGVQALERADQVMRKLEGLDLSGP